jgi:hypothetical protein
MVFEQNPWSIIQKSYHLQETGAEEISHKGQWVIQQHGEIGTHMMDDHLQRVRDNLICVPSLQGLLLQGE